MATYNDKILVPNTTKDGLDTIHPETNTGNVYDFKNSKWLDELLDVATVDRLGLIKPDGTTIKVDELTGVASVEGVEVKEYIGDLNNLIEDGQYESPISTLNAPSTTKHLIHVQSSIDKSVVIQTAISITNSGNRQTYRRVGHKNGGVYIWTVDTNPGSLNGWKIEDINLSDSITDSNIHRAATANAVKMVNDKVSGIPIGFAPRAPFVEEGSGYVGIARSGNIATFFFQATNSQQLAITNTYQLCDAFPVGYRNTRTNVVGYLSCVVSAERLYIPVTIINGIATMQKPSKAIPINTRIDGQISFFAE